MDENKMEIVISGMSGCFPTCNNQDEFKEALFSGRNLSELNPYKWETEEYQNLRYGVLKKSQKFDAFGFGVSGGLTRYMDPCTKRLLELSFECFIDAGMNPANMKNSKTAVIMVTNVCEWEHIRPHPHDELNRHGMLGKGKVMDANRISFFFGFTGPSYVMYGTEATALQALQNAVNLLKKGVCQQVVVGGANVILQPFGFHGFKDQLHMLSPDCETRSFSDDANGFWRSDAAVVFLVQKKKDALKSYAVIDNIYTGILPGPENQLIANTNVSMEKFLEEAYAHEDVNDIALMVAEGYGNPDYDAGELNAISSAIASKRKEPLIVTSTKSVTGHSMCGSSLFSIVSAIMSLQTDTVIPIINYTTGNRLVPALRDGSIKIYTEKVPLRGNRVAVNSFSSTSSTFGHLILRRDFNLKPTISVESPIPYLVGISGRDDEAMSEVLLRMKSVSPLQNAVALCHRAFKQNIERSTFRGYAILNDQHTSVLEKFDLPRPRPIWFIYSGMGSQWLNMGKQLMAVPCFAESVQKIHQVLLKEGINFIRVVTEDDPAIMDDITNAFIGITGIQVALTDMLKTLGVKPDGIIGHSLGEVACAYADDCLTYDQAVLAALARGRASVESKLEHGMMAAVGLGYNQIKSRLPEGIEVACHNSATSCTLSGKTEVMETFINKLKSENIFARLVNVNNIAYHSKYIKPAAPFLLSALEKVIPVPKRRSSKWVSTSVTEDKWNTEVAQMSSARYHTNNLLNYVYFEEGCKHIPDDAICIEIAPHGLLQAIVKKSLPSCAHVPLTNKGSKDPISFLLSAVGTMFLNGVELNLENLYPPVALPVPGSTWSISQLVTWDHTMNWGGEYFEYKNKGDIFSSYFYFNPEDDEDKKLMSNYKICSQSKIPCLFLLGKVIKMFYNNKKLDLSTSILLQNIEFHDVDFPESKTEMYITLFCDGKFEVVILERRECLLSGMIEELFDSSNYFPKEFPQICSENSSLTKFSQQEIYSQFENFGIHLDGPFKQLNSIVVSDKGLMSQITSCKEIEYQIGAILSSFEFYSLFENGSLRLVSKINRLVVDPKQLSHQPESKVAYDTITRNIIADGIFISHITLGRCRKEVEEWITLKKSIFVPYHTYVPQNEAEFYDICSAMIIENTPKPANDSIKSVITVAITDNVVPVTLHKAITVSAYCETKVLSLSELLVEVSHSESKRVVVTYKGASIPPKLYDAMSKSNVFVFLHSPSRQKAALPKDVVIIYSFGNIVLIKKKRASINVNNIVKTSIPNWEQLLPKTETKEPFFIVLDNMFLADFIDTIARLINKVPNCVRFLCIDQKSPPFDVKSSVYQDIMRNDFKICISQGEALGSLRNVQLEQLKPNESFNIQAGEEKQKSNVEIRAVGMSFNDPIKPTKSSQVSALEYSGLKNGKTVMGICNIESGTLKTDDILQWNYPSNWTAQQAATTPLYYSMAYYGIIKYGKGKKGITVLIHAGYSLLSQVFIRVALSIGCQVFTTYFTEEQRRFIISTFPELPEEHIIHCHKSKFGMQFMTLTDGMGANLVVNTLGTEYVDFSLEVLHMSYGSPTTSIMVQISDEPMTENINIGMEIFLKECGIHGLVNQGMLKLNEDDKKWVQEKVEEGIKNGAVKPLDFLALDMYETPAKIKNTAVDFSNTLPMKKVVVSLTNNSNSVKSGTHQEKAVLLVGKNHSLCYDIICSHASKACRHFHIFLNKQEISPLLAGRFKELEKKIPNITFEFHPTKILDSAHECEILIQHIQKNAVLEHVYHISSDRSTVQFNHLDTALRKFAKAATLIAVGKPAQKISEMRRKDGYNSITFLPSQVPNHFIANSIEKITGLQHRSIGTVVIENSSSRVMDDAKIIKSCLPDDLEELLGLSNCQRLKHSESLALVTTHGLDYFLSDFATPIIMLPGMRPHKLSKFCRSIPYPVYMAKLPHFDETTNNLTHIALPIAEDIMAKFPELTVLNLISEGWSTALALVVTQILEENGKKCAIFMLNETPSMIQHSLSSVTDLSVFAKYFDLSLEALEKLKKLPTWDAKIAHVLQMENMEYNKEVVKKSLNYLHHMITLIKKFDMFSTPIKGKIILFSAESQYSKESANDLQKCSPNPIHDVRVKGDDVLCPESVPLLQLYPMHQAVFIPLDKLDVNELSCPVSTRDIQESKTLDADEAGRGIYRTSFTFNILYEELYVK